MRICIGQVEVEEEAMGCEFFFLSLLKKDLIIANIYLYLIVLLT